MLCFRRDKFNKIIIKKKNTKKCIKSSKILYKLYKFLILILFTFSFFYVVKNLDKRLFPSVLAITDKIMKSKVNETVNDSVNRLIKEMDLKASDFYIKSQDAGGKINYLTVNTVLINQLCTQVSLDVTKVLNNGEFNKVSIPIGTLLGIDILANTGPKYKVNILPMGDVVIDYRSSFESVGINQINFQVWLDIGSAIQVINPLQKTEIILDKKVSLVNTVITGEVPIAYVNMPKKLENIN